MPRYKNANWDLPENVSNTHHAMIALFMDLRDELQMLNAEFARVHTYLNLINSFIRKVENKKRK